MKTLFIFSILIISITLTESRNPFSFHNLNLNQNITQNHSAAKLKHDFTSPLAIFLYVVAAIVFFALFLYVCCCISNHCVMFIWTFCLGPFEVPHGIVELVDDEEPNN
jgi:hypothetical protein